MAASRQAAKEFISQKRIALAGLSRDPKCFTHTIAKSLVEHGIEVIPVNAKATEIGGKPCYATLGAIPGPVDGVLSMVPVPEHAKVLKEAVDAGVKRVWLHLCDAKNPAVGEAVAAARKAGVTVIDSVCPYMFMSPVKFPHNVHGWIAGVTGKIQP